MKKMPIILSTLIVLFTITSCSSDIDEIYDPELIESSDITTKSVNRSSTYISGIGTVDIYEIYGSTKLHITWDQPLCEGQCYSYCSNSDHQVSDVRFDGYLSNYVPNLIRGSIEIDCPEPLQPGKSYAIRISGGGSSYKIINYTATGISQCNHDFQDVSTWGQYLYRPNSSILEINYPFQSYNGKTYTLIVYWNKAVNFSGIPVDYYSTATIDNSLLGAMAILSINVPYSFTSGQNNALIPVRIYSNEGGHQNFDECKHYYEAWIEFSSAGSDSASPLSFTEVRQ